jgi:hypothetical protein
MKLFLYLFLIFAVTDLFPQEDSTAVDNTGENNSKLDSTIVEFNLFTVQLKDKILSVVSNEGELKFTQQFQNPVFTVADLDSDTVDEYILIDYKILDNKKDFTIYVYNTIDTFYCVDSIRSGFYEPYVFYSEEVKGNVIIAGIPGFDELNIGKTDTSMPLNVWRYSENGLELINDQIYDLFQSENESVVDFLSAYFDSNVKNCNSSEQVNNVIAAGYINYKNSGELSVANQFLLKYYLCADIKDFKTKIENLSVR